MGRSVIVVGAGQGGLSAAIYARLAGHDVFVLEKSDRVGGKAAAIQIGGYRLDLGPSIIILTRIYERVFQDAGRSLSDYLELQRLDPISQVRLEGSSPFDLPADPDEAIRVLSAVSPQDGPAIKSLFRKLRSISRHIDRSVFDHPFHRAMQLLEPHLIQTALPFNMRKSYKELIDGWFQNPLLRAFFYGFPSYGGQSYDSKSIGALMIPFLMLEEGVWYPVGGVAAIPMAFEKLARELGVRFVFDAEVVSLSRQSNRIKEVTTSQGERYEADAVICNVDRFTVAAWLGAPCNLEPSYSYFTMHWGIKQPMSELRHHTLCIPKSFERGFEELYREKRFPERPIVYLNATTATDPSASPAGCTNLFAVVTAPAMLPDLDWPKRVDEFRGRTLDTLRQCGIELAAGDIEFERIQTPVTFAERDGSYLGSLYGPDEKHRLWGLFPARVRDERFKNLFYCGGSVQPGAGLPMVTLSGKFAASMLD